MKIVGFELNNVPRLGLIDGDEVIDLQLADEGIGILRNPIEDERQ